MSKKIWILIVVFFFVLGLGVGGVVQASIAPDIQADIIDYEIFKSNDQYYYLIDYSTEYELVGLDNQLYFMVPVKESVED